MAAANPSVDLKQIRQEMLRVGTIVRRTTDQLRWVDEHHIPDSQPYVSFKIVTRIEDLKRERKGLRDALRATIQDGKAALRELELMAQQARRDIARAAAAREHDAIVKAERDADRAALALFEQASRRGSLTAQEYAQVQNGLLKGLKAHAEFLSRHPTRRHIHETLDKLGLVYAMGMDDTETAKSAMAAVRQASHRLVQQAKLHFEKHPGRKTLAALASEIATSQLFGNESAESYLDHRVLPKLNQILADAEKRFRLNPTVEHYHAMVDAELACVEMGGSAIASPPAGLRRIKAGSSRTFGPRDMLSAVSKEFYGSFGYWDVIVRANSETFKDPGKPLPGPVNIVIPF